MELDAMISEICRKVQERVAELEKEEASAEPAAVPSEDNRPALLILAEDHGMRCHPVLESKKLAECYRVECALLKEEDCDVASYEGVIAFTLTNEALGKDCQRNLRYRLHQKIQEPHFSLEKGYLLRFRIWCNRYQKLRWQFGDCIRHVMRSALSWKTGIASSSWQSIPVAFCKIFLLSSAGCTASWYSARTGRCRPCLSSDGTAAGCCRCLFFSSATRSCTFLQISLIIA